MSRYLYQTLSNKLKFRILQGYYQPGELLPSIRTLAEQEDCNPATIQRAIKTIEKQGLIFHKCATGLFVIENSKHIEKLRECEAAIALKQLYKGLHAL